MLSAVEERRTAWADAASLLRVAPRVCVVGRRREGGLGEATVREAIELMDDSTCIWVSCSSSQFPVKKTLNYNTDLSKMEEHVDDRVSVGYDVIN